MTRASSTETLLSGRMHSRLDVTVIAAIAAVLFVIRVASPSNLLDQDQENPAAYVLDVVKNGNWICQRDLAGRISSKPPVYTWLAAVFSSAAGEVNLVTLYLPGALALAATACLVFRSGTRWFGARAGFVAALATMLCTAGLKQFGLARTDGVFAFTVTATALLAWRAWVAGKGWTWFWLAAAVATLTKGPLGVVLGALGLLAVFWERRSTAPLPLRGRHALGVALFFGITVGWVLMAYLQFGEALVDKLLVRELLYHAVEGERKTIPGSLLYLSPLYYLARAAPWSLFAFYGLWRVWRAPSPDPAQRRFERFLFCWFAGGLFIFSMSPHQRGDLLWPIMPAGALLAGRELARLTERVNWRRFRTVTAVVVLAAIAGFAWYFNVPRGRSVFIQQTAAVKQVAEEIERRGGRDFPLTHTDDPSGLQVFLNTYRPPVSLERAAGLLRGKDAAFVAATNLRALEAWRQPGDAQWHVLLRDDGPLPKLGVHIVSNRPSFALTETCALAWGPWTLRYNGQLLTANGNEVAFGHLGHVPGTLKNESQEPASIRVHLTQKGRRGTQTFRVTPGRSVALPPPADR